MYVPPVFKTADAKAWAFIEARGFGTLIAVDAGRPVAAHLPFLVEHGADGTRIAAHVARANPLHDIVVRAPNVLLTVMGPDAYISPDWYVTKAQVPTWNYVSVHITGTARVVARDGNLAHVDRLSAVFEQRLAPKPPWKSAKMPADRLDAMLGAIVGLEIAVASIEAQWKLAQHKTRPDRIEVARMLEWRGDWGSHGVAELMNAGLKER